MDRKATERVYVGGKDTEGVEYGTDCNDTIQYNKLYFNFHTCQYLL